MQYQRPRKYIQQQFCNVRVPLICACDGSLGAGACAASNARTGNVINAAANRALSLDFMKMTPDR